MEHRRNLSKTQQHPAMPQDWAVICSSSCSTRSSLAFSCSAAAQRAWGIEQLASQVGRLRKPSAIYHTNYRGLKPNAVSFYLACKWLATNCKDVPPLDHELHSLTTNARQPELPSRTSPKRLLFVSQKLRCDGALGATLIRLNATAAMANVGLKTHLQVSLSLSVFFELCASLHLVSESPCQTSARPPPTALAQTWHFLDRTISALTVDRVS